MEWILFFSGVLAAYLFGAIPSAYLIGKWYGKDIRKEGSGNIGATNVTRVIGSRAGKLCFVFDFLKGFLPVFVAARFFPEHELPLAAGAAAILGHMYPVYLGFKGGKGVATGGGVALGLAPYALCAALAGWGVTFWISRYVSLASIVAALLLPLFGTLLFLTLGAPSIPVQAFLYAIGLVTIVKHKSNIKRLAAGEEQRFERRKGKTE